MIRMLKMEIIGESGTFYRIRVSGDGEYSALRFSPEEKTLEFDDESELTGFLKRNEYQFRKLLHNKKPSTFYNGFELTFTIINGKDVAAYNDRSNVVVVDGYSGTVGVKSKEDKWELIEIYTDGSFNEKRSVGGCAILIRNLAGEYAEHMFTTASQSSSLIELEAVIRALELVKGDARIITDSQYVRKGITEWIVHWKHNKWTTANGTKAKNIEVWKKLDQLCQNRYIELEWVKAHSDHFENDYCDYQSRKITLKQEEGK
jgi:ribonuclease HI